VKAIIGRRPMVSNNRPKTRGPKKFPAAKGRIYQPMSSDLTLTLCWSIIFFFASAAASSAYLTVSETFPLEIRALAIAIFYAIGTGLGGVAAPYLFGVLIATGSRASVFGGYLFGAALMIAAAVVAALYAVAAERKPLEAVARPLALED